jgi:two-component system chemotaxis sensor kinase CheA
MSTTGHEDEFRRLFEEEAQARLALLAEQALELEARGADPELVDAMFRHAHTLKGGAGVVGFGEFADVVHDLEGLIEDVREARLPASAPVADAILSVVDALADMVPRAMAGEDQAGPQMMARAAIDSLGERAAPRPKAPEPEPGGGLVVLGGADLGRPAPEAPGASIAVPVARLDELVRLVGEGAAAQLRVGRVIAERLGDEPAVLDDYRNLARVLGTLQEQAMRARMVSVETVTGPLRRAARDLARAGGKQVDWEILGGETELDRHVLEGLREPLVALVRNAVDHGIEPEDERLAHGKPATGRIRVHAMQLGAEIVISVADDGRGIDLERVRAAAGGGLDDDAALAAIFRPGVSTADRLTGISGRGVGLDAVRQAVGELRGRIEVHSNLGRGTEFRISVPMTLAVLRCLILRAGGRDYALPLRSAVGLLPGTDEVRAEGRAAVWVGGDAVGLCDLGALLGGTGEPAGGPVVVVSALTGRHAFRVDALLGQRDVVVKELGRVLPRLDLIGGASVELDGSVMLVLDPGGLLHAAGAEPRVLAPASPGIEAPAAPVVLVVDDALTVRELQRTILERAGYEVVTVAGGEAALAHLAGARVDLVLTDVEMPGMDGFVLTERIRASERHRNLPVLVLSTRGAEQDRRRGLEAGADGYLVKSAFDEHGLLAAVKRLLGRPADPDPPE